MDMDHTLTRTQISGLYAGPLAGTDENGSVSHGNAMNDNEGYGKARNENAKKNSIKKNSIKKNSAAQRKQIIKRHLILRTIIQLVFFISMPSAFVAGFSGAKYIFNQVSTGSLLSKNDFLVILIFLCVYTIVAGRFFCGYICAFGTLGDVIYALSGQVQMKILKKKKQYKLPLSILPWLQKIKYAILAAVLLMCGTGIYGKLQGTSPWDIFSQLTALKLNINGYAIGMVIFILILAGMGVQERFFCQFLCPMGAIFSLLPVLPAATLKRDAANCPKKCNVCQQNCPVGLKLENNSSRSGECIRCGKCAVYDIKSVNIRSFGKLNGTEIWLVILKAVLFFGIGTALGLCRFV